MCRCGTARNSTDSSDHPWAGVNAVAPGFIITDMTLENKPAFESYRAASPIGMLGEPEYIAEAVSYVVGAEFMTGQVISPNGGLVI